MFQVIRTNGLALSLLLVCPLSISRADAVPSADVGVRTEAGPEASAPSSAPTPSAPTPAASSAAAPPEAALSAAPASPSSAASLPTSPTSASEAAPGVVTPIFVGSRDLESVRFVANHDQAIPLFVRGAKGEWTPICTSPCNFPAPPGPRDYAAPIKRGPAYGGLRVGAEQLWLAPGDGLQAEFVSRAVVRKVGAGILTAGLLALVFLPFIAWKDATLAAVLVPSATFTVTGAVMVALRDRVRMKRCKDCHRGR